MEKGKRGTKTEKKQFQYFLNNDIETPNDMYEESLNLILNEITKCYSLKKLNNHTIKIHSIHGVLDISFSIENNKILLQIQSPDNPNQIEEYDILDFLYKIDNQFKIELTNIQQAKLLKKFIWKNGYFLNNNNCYISHALEYRNVEIKLDLIKWGPTISLTQFDITIIHNEQYFKNKCSLIEIFFYFKFWKNFIQKYFSKSLSLTTFAYSG